MLEKKSEKRREQSGIECEKEEHQNSANTACFDAAMGKNIYFGQATRKISQRRHRIQREASAPSKGSFANYDLADSKHRAK